MTIPYTKIIITIIIFALISQVCIALGNTKSDQLLQPTPPLNLQAKVMEDENLEFYVLLTWEPPAYTGGYPLSEYHIYVSTQDIYNQFLNHSALPQPLIVDANKTSYKVYGLENNKTYFFFVTAVNSVGNESFPSNEVSVTIPQPPSPLLKLFLRIFPILLVIPIMAVIIITSSKILKIRGTLKLSKHIHKGIFYGGIAIILMAVLAYIWGAVVSLMVVGALSYKWFDILLGLISPIIVGAFFIIASFWGENKKIIVYEGYAWLFIGVIFIFFGIFLVFISSLLSSNMFVISIFMILMGLHFIRSPSPPSDNRLI